MYALTEGTHDPRPQQNHPQLQPFVKDPLTYADHQKDGSLISVLKKVNQSHYRPRQAQRVLRKLRFPDFVTTAPDSGKVVSLTHRPPLPPGNTPGTHFC